MGRICDTRGKMRNAYKTLVGRPEGKRPFGRSRRRWEDNIRIVLREIGWEGVDWIHLAKDRYQWRALREHGNELSVSIRGGEFLD
jgi:hypothetical protein